MKKNKPIVIEYYSDVLCVWAWIAQKRIEELKKTLKNDIQLECYYVDIFGDVPKKIEDSWHSKGGYDGFSEHVIESASAFEGLEINNKIWSETRPTTSANAHLVLKAIENNYGEEKSSELALVFRKAFFKHALNIGSLTILLKLADESGLDADRLNKALEDGTAMAALMSDYQRSKLQNIKGSPSYVMDGGRQTLYGNVSYRVLLANVEELLKTSQDGASWC